MLVRTNAGIPVAWWLATLSDQRQSSVVLRSDDVVLGCSTLVATWKGPLTYLRLFRTVCLKNNTQRKKNFCKKVFILKKAVFTSTKI
uniref:Uncharacterized protein n=1 Tax=Ixodes ricinus TaxID=34613 RepID=A0A6B0TZ18_IXORI